jgi:hypothetical protein
MIFFSSKVNDLIYRRNLEVLIQVNVYIKIYQRTNNSNDADSNSYEMMKEDALKSMTIIRR